MEQPQAKKQKKRVAPRAKVEPMFEQTKATALVLESPKTPAPSPKATDQNRSKKQKTTKKVGTPSGAQVDTPQAPAVKEKTTTAKKKKPAVVLSDSEADEFDSLLKEVDIENEVLSASDSDDMPLLASSKKTENAATPSSKQFVEPDNIVDTRLLLLNNDEGKEQEFSVEAEQCLVLRGCAKVRVLKGEALINGFKLSPKLVHGVEVFSEVSHALLSVQNVGSGDCIVGITPVLSPATIALEPGSAGATETRLLDFSDDIKQFANQPYTKPILVCGARNTGKSSFSRFLVNSLLTRHDSVAFLECDIGQSEFTPPGLVSLNVVHEPLLGSPHTHQRVPVCSFFLGANTSSAHPELYCKSILHCYRHYRRYMGSSNPVVPLVINTQGWITGLGLDLLLRCIKDIQPRVVELQGTTESLNIQDATKFQVQVRRNTSSAAAHARNLAFLSYFLPRMPDSLHEVGRSLSQQQPKLLERRKMWLHSLYGELVEVEETFEGMLVGLCCVPSLSDPPYSSSLSTSSSSSLSTSTSSSSSSSSSPYSSPSTAAHSGILRDLPDDALCVGLALVQSIDAEWLQLLTPADVNHVNVLVKGELGLPSAFHYTEGCQYMTPSSSLATVGGAKAMNSRRNVRRKSGA